MLEHDPDLNLGKIRVILARSANDLGKPGRDPVSGAGRAEP
jgi:hypothetical protein